MNWFALEWISESRVDDGNSSKIREDFFFNSSSDGRLAMGKGRRRVAHDEYFRERLAEPWLLARAVFVNVEGDEQVVAVPVGRLRRGGQMEFLDKRKAEKTMKRLTGNKGFPNLRVIIHRLERGKPPRLFELRWGDPPPFDGCDYLEPICALLLGLHYGYKNPAIAELVVNYMKLPRRAYSRRRILEIIRSARSSQ
jgi:Family of unknown function (DUF6302)